MRLQTRASDPVGTNHLHCYSHLVTECTMSPSRTADALLRASRALVGIAARSLGDVEVTLSQFRALVVLARWKGMTVTDLAGALSIHPSTATRLCDRLVGKELVRRSQGSDDRRETLVHLTARGARLVALVSDRRRADLEVIAAALPEISRAAVVEAFEVFAAAAGEPEVVDLFGWVDDADDRS